MGFRFRAVVFVITVSHSVTRNNIGPVTTTRIVIHNTLRILISACGAYVIDLLRSEIRNETIVNIPKRAQASVVQRINHDFISF